MKADARVVRLLAAIETTPVEDADAWQRIVRDLRLSPTARKQLPRDLRVVLGDKPRKFWTDDALSVVRKLYASHPTADVAKALGCTVLAVYRQANELGIKKSREFLAREVWPAFGRSPGFIAARFPKGNVPVNKGVKRPGWHAGRMKETQFKKGSRGRNWKPVGTILPDSEGYLRIKAREGVHGKDALGGFGNTLVWPFLSRVIWEQHHGPIPPKHIVTYKDKDRGNCVLENLELLSMRKNAQRNVMWNRLPRELCEVIQLSGVLKRQIRRLSGKEQNQ